MTETDIKYLQGGPYGSQFADFSDDAKTAEVLKDEAVSLIDGYSASGDIDDTSNIANIAVVIVSGSDDTVVPPKNQEAVQLIYQNYNAASDTLNTLSGYGHSFPYGTV